MKRKWMAVFLAVVTLALGACGAKEEGTEGQNGTVNNETPAPTGDAGKDEGEKEYAEHLVISLASVQVNESVDYNNGDEFTKWWTEKFNFEWDVIGLSWDVWAERLQIGRASCRERVWHSV